MLRSFNDYMTEKKALYGDKFDTSELNAMFIPYFENQRRIEVSFRNENNDCKEYDRKRGTVGITTGWKPVFLLMLTKRSIGSSYVIRMNDVIIKEINKHK